MLPSLVPLSTKAARHLSRALLAVPEGHRHAWVAFIDVDRTHHIAAAERTADGWRITAREPEMGGPRLRHGARVYWSGDV